MPIIVHVRGEEVTVTSQELGKNPTLRMLIERVNAHWRGWKSPLPRDIQQYYYRERQFYQDDLDKTLDELGIKDGTTLMGSTVPYEKNSQRDLSPGAIGVVSDGTFDGLPTVMQQSIGDYLSSDEIKTTGLKDIFQLSDDRIEKNEKEGLDQIIDPLRKNDPDKYKKYDEIINFLEGLDFPKDWSSMDKDKRGVFLRRNRMWEKFKNDGFLAQLRYVDLSLFKTDPDKFLESIINVKNLSSSVNDGSFNFLIYWALKCGARINKPMSDGETPLIHLLRFPKGVMLLLEYGANINGVNTRGETALMVACARGFIETVELLLNNSAAVNHVTTKGDSALMFACRAPIPNSLTVVERLLKRGADINCVNKEGQTAYSIVTERGFVAKLTLLKQYQTKDEKKIGHMTRNLTSPGSSGTFRQKHSTPSEEKSENLKKAHAIIDKDTLDELDTIINSTRCKYDYNRGNEFITIVAEPGGGNVELCKLRDQFKVLFQQRGKENITAEVEEQDRGQSDPHRLIIKGISLTELEELIKPPVASSTSTCIIS